MKPQLFRIACLGGVLLLTPAAVAKSGKEPAPPAAVIAELSACRAIADNSARLACFDSVTQKVDAAVASKELYVVDRAQVRKAKRSLFGLTLPDLGLLGGGDAKDAKDSNEISQIDTVVKSARETGDGNWLVVTEEGSTWLQTDGATLALNPRPGAKLTIKKAALGSFKMNVGSQPAVRVRRVI
jgi:hypothetical protein